MDISSILGTSSVSESTSSTSSITDLLSTTSTDEEETDIIEELTDIYSSESDEEIKLTTYTDVRNMTNAQLIEKFANYTSNQVTKQVANYEAFYEELSESAEGEYTAEELETMLYEEYGITATLDAANIEEGGMYSAENLSSSIVDFAISLSGGDTSKAEMLLEAAKEGFEQAESLWGGELPEISQETYDLMIEKFDAWVNGTYETEE